MDSRGPTPWLRQFISVTYPHCCKHVKTSLQVIVPLQLLCPGWWELNIGLKFWSSLLTLLKSPWWERAALDICTRAGHLWSCVSFSYEVHLAYVSDSIEVSQPRFVSCSAKQSAERDSCVSYSTERPCISCRATNSRRDSCVSISGEKGHVFLAEPQRAGEILACPFKKKKATFPVFLPRPEEVSGREFMCPFQHREAKFNSCSAENCERKSKFSEILVRCAEKSFSVQSFSVKWFQKVLPECSLDLTGRA